MLDSAALTLNSDCYCWEINRATIIDKILDQNSAPNMAAMLSERPHYFSSTAIFLASSILSAMKDQIQAIEDVIKLPAYIEAVRRRHAFPLPDAAQTQTNGVFMGYDFHITSDGPRLIEINSNAGGAFIVNMIELSAGVPSTDFKNDILKMFKAEWATFNLGRPLNSVAIIDANPSEQYHYPDMCLAKATLEAKGVSVIITDPKDLKIENGVLYHKGLQIDLVYNRLTDFNLIEPANAIIRDAYLDGLALVTPAPHHHALYADKRNLILLSDPETMTTFGASPAQLNALALIPKTEPVTPETTGPMWRNRRSLFFKPQAGFGSRGAFRGAKLTKKVWGEICAGGYIAQEQIPPPIRAVTVNEQKTALKFDVRAYTYNEEVLLLAARVYQGQTTNLRTAGGGLAPVIPIGTPGLTCIR